MTPQDSGRGQRVLLNIGIMLAMGAIILLLLAGCKAQKHSIENISQASERVQKHAEVRNLSMLDSLMHSATLCFDTLTVSYSVIDDSDTNCNYGEAITPTGKKSSVISLKAVNGSLGSNTVRVINSAGEKVVSDSLSSKSEMASVAEINTERVSIYTPPDLRWVLVIISIVIVALLAIKAYKQK